MHNIILAERVTKEFLFKQITEEDIFCRYFPLDNIEEGVYYTNPLRDDDDAGCTFYRNANSSILYFKDFAWKSFTCIDYVMEMYRLNYPNALEHIAYTFNLIDGNNSSQLLTTPIQPKQKSNIRIAEKDFTEVELNFWRRFDPAITQVELNDLHIHSLHSVWVNSARIYIYRRGHISFYYHLAPGYNYQVYTSALFFNRTKYLQTGNGYIIGQHLLRKTANYVVIGKAGKDWFVSYKLHINCVGQLTESVMLDHDFVLWLFQHYDYVFTLFDNDKTGKLLSIKYKKKYKTIPLLFAKTLPKDISDNFIHDKDSLIDTILYLKGTYGLTD
jgi:hypothetical protein